MPNENTLPVIAFQKLEDDADALTQHLAQSEAKAQKIAGDTRLTAPARAADLEALEADTQAAVITKREETRARLTQHLADLDDHEEALYGSAQLRPRTAEEWTMASARAAFARDDAEALARTDPARLLRQYRCAVKAKDNVTAFLLARYAPAALEAAQRREEALVLRQLVDAAEAVDADRLLQAKMTRQRLGSIGQRLDAAKTPAERRALAGKLKVDPRYLPK